MRRGEPSHACSAGSRAGCSTIPKRGAVSASMLTFSGFLCLNLVLIAVADVIDPALVLWYPFQGNFSNLGLGGGTLSQIGSPVVNASYPGYLTGGSCYFNNPNSASGASPNYFISNTGLTEGSAVTVAVWVLVNNQSFTQSILGLNNAANGPFGLTFDVQTNRAFLAATSSTLTSGYNWDVIITSLGNQWPVGVWFHAAVTFSTSPALVTVFLNGNQIASTAPTRAMTGINRLTIGSAGDNARGFYGNLADLRLYNRTLAASEILNLYNVDTSASASITPTPTSSATVSSTTTVSTTSSTTQTTTVSASTSATTTVTVTVTSTVSVTASSTVTLTSTVTLSSTVSPTVTSTTSVTYSSSTSSSSTVSSSSSPTVTLSSSSSPTVTTSVSTSTSPSSSPSTSTSPSYSASTTYSPSPSSTLTPSCTGTQTQTATRSNTGTSSSSGSTTPSVTPTMTVSSTGTVLPSTSATTTPSPTNSAYTPINCRLSGDWSEWSACIPTNACNTSGFTARYGVVAELPLYGGTDCPSWPSVLHEASVCSRVPSPNCGSLCFDGVMDGGETGVDCGGNSTCGPCGVGQGCAFPEDCQSALTCGIGGVCISKLIAASQFYLNGSLSFSGLTPAQLLTPPGPATVSSALANLFGSALGVAIQPWGVALVVVRPATTLQPCYINTTSVSAKFNVGTLVQFVVALDLNGISPADAPHLPGIVSALTPLLYDTQLSLLIDFSPSSPSLCAAAFTESNGSLVLSFGNASLYSLSSRTGGPTSGVSPAIVAAVCAGLGIVAVGAGIGWYVITQRHRALVKKFGERPAMLPRRQWGDDPKTGDVTITMSPLHDSKRRASSATSAEVEALHEDLFTSRHSKRVSMAPVRSGGGPVKSPVVVENPSRLLSMYKTKGARTQGPMPVRREEKAAAHGHIEDFDDLG